MRQRVVGDRSLRRLLLGGCVIALAGVLSACGLKGATQFLPDVEPGSVQPVADLDGVKVSVGSKDFTEQLILGKIAALVLTVAGVDVVDQTGIAGSATARIALQGGEIDLMWDYTGTGWITYLQHTDPIPGEEAQWQAVRDEDLKKNGIVWLPPASMNNTYGMAIREEKAEELGITKMSDWASLPREELTFCVDKEFAARNDGFEPMLETYGVALGSTVPLGNVRTMDLGVVYTAIDRGSCNFGEVFATDGRIKALDLRVLEDDKQFFPQYNATVVLREQLYDAHPAVAEVLEPVISKITDDVMQDLNARVDVDGEDPALVARDWLRSETFVR